MHVLETTATTESGLIGAIFQPGRALIAAPARASTTAGARSFFIKVRLRDRRALYFSIALRMHTKRCLLCTHVRVDWLTSLAVPARPYYSRAFLLQDYYSSALVSTTLACACPVVWSWVTVGTSHGTLDFPRLVAASWLSPPFAKNFFCSLGLSWDFGREPNHLQFSNRHGQ